MKRLAVFLAFTAVGCGHLDAPAPESFAVFDDGPALRAVTADGVVYRVRRVDNDPEATLEFWQEALALHMVATGYKRIADGTLPASAAGCWIELAAPMGQEDHSYLVAVFVRGGHLLIAEAAGEVARFAAHREAILAAITRLGAS